MKKSKSKIVLSGILVLAVLALAVPAASAYDSDQTYNANSTYFVPEDIVVEGYCNNETVEIWTNTTVPIIGGKIGFDYTYCCANVTDFELNTTNWILSQWSPPPNPAFLPGTFAVEFFNFFPVGPGPVHLGDLTIHCCNQSSECITNLTWIQGPMYGLGDVSYNPVENVNWVNGTFRCKKPAQPVEVRVNAPEYVEETFTATIRIDNVTELNAAQFDFSFNSSVVNVTDVKGGEIDGKAVPLYNWNFTDSDAIRVISKLSGVEGANGSGYLAVVEFEVKGKAKESSKLDISKGKLSNVSAKEINADWFDAEVTVLRTAVWVDAPAYVNETFNTTIRIDNVTELNAAQFDLSFNSSVVNVTDVKGGEINGKAVPLYNWNFTDSDTIRVISKLSGVEGANGSGYLAVVEFGVKGKRGESSKLDISEGKLSNVSAKEINADWFDAEVTVEAPVFDTGERDDKR